MSHELVVADGEGDRVDRWLRKRFPTSPRREIQRIISEGLVTRGGRRLAKGQMLRDGQAVELLELPGDDSSPLPSPEGVELDVLYEDDSLIAINKPPGLPTHPLDIGELGCAANRVVARYPECADASSDPREGGAVHRLDLGTSGVLLFARSAEAYGDVRSQFRAGTVSKTYWALCESPPEQNPIELPLEQRGQRSVVSENGLPSSTSWVELGRGKDVLLLECATASGRRHQVRAHLAAAGAPILGDTLYGGAPGPVGLTDFFLHARELRLSSPSAGPIVVVAALPVQRRAVLERCQIDGEHQV